MIEWFGIHKYRIHRWAGGQVRRITQHLITSPYYYLITLMHVLSAKVATQISVEIKMVCQPSPHHMKELGEPLQ